jgi:ABC-type sugar transport system ATPase subunit
MPAGENILELRGITKAFPGVSAVNQVNFNLKPGEVHAVVGENGAGKSTLMNILGGVLQPDAGDIYLEGKLTWFADAADAGRRGIAVVFQELSLVPMLSVAENIFFNRQPVTPIGFVASNRLNNDARQLLRLFELTVDPSTPVRELSVSYRQIVEVLKAVSLCPKILILDEPTSSLGAAEIERLFFNIRRLKSEGVSLIYISHHLPEIFQIADRVTVLRDGRNAGTFATSQVDEELLVKRMVGRELTNRYGAPGDAVGDYYFRFERTEGSRESIPNPADAGPNPGAAQISNTPALQYSARPNWRTSRKRLARAPGVRLDLRRGEILGIAGLIGSGRSELAMEMVGITPNPRCAVFLEGRRLSFRHPADAIRQGVLYVTEDRKELGLYLSMSVQDNCVAPTLRTYANRIGFLSARRIRSAALSARQRFRIATPSVGKLVGELSGGTQQKVLLAMWTNARPKVLVVDEPTKGVDVGAKSEIYRLLRELARSGIGIIMISSELQEILGLSDRIKVMRGGRFVAEFSRETASEEKLILAATGLATELTE